ncbi:4239_t:CDS:1 [Dentiscutata erythropus]|uniref:4239_t:CDS:1 n=1 Tax=Dentiscutata erythropus TaxID=1348616 RepID=A0A9N9JPP0_9GLOM|nr:4239_t:CDS:1 [Dentiscutata erythropus]
MSNKEYYKKMKILGDAMKESGDLKSYQNHFRLTTTNIEDIIEKYLNKEEKDFYIEHHGLDALKKNNDIKQFNKTFLTNFANKFLSGSYHDRILAKLETHVFTS